jgi:TRAP-type C4-dicarboxylate transport system permease small subunit
MGYLLGDLSRWSDRLARLLIAVMMGAMVLDVLLGVVNRFVFKFSFSWSEQLARFLLIWISMLGASIAVRIGAHIGITFLVARLGRWRNRLMLINAAMVIGFLLVVGGYGLKLCITQSRQFSPVMQISMFWPYLSVPAGCLLMIIHYLAALKEPGRVFNGVTEPKEGLPENG